QAVGLHRGGSAVFAESALAHVEDLLAFEQRVHDDGPFLQRGRHVPTIGGSWMTRSCPATSDCPRTSRSHQLRDTRRGSCSVTVFPTTRGVRRPSAPRIRSSPTTSRV